MNDDAALLRRYAENRDEAAFAELVRRHLDLVYSAALRRLGGDAHAAADIAQQVFTTLARDAQKLSRHAVLTAWLYAATRNAAVDHIRSEQRRAKREQEATAMQTLFVPDASDADWEKLRPVLDEVMDALSDADRTAVLLRFFEKRPFADVGAALAVGEDAARMRVERALQKLHALLARRGVTSIGAALASVLTNHAIGSAPASLAANITAQALAGVSSGGLTAGTLGFMSTSKTLAGMAALVVAMGLGSAVYEANLARRANAESDVLRRERDVASRKLSAAEASLRTAEQKAATVTERVATLEKDLASAKKESALAAARTTPPRGSTTNSASIWSKPDYVRLDLEKFRASLPLRYGSLYHALNLSPDQIAKFEAALIEGRRGLVDVWVAASAQGLPTGGGSSAATSVARLTVEPNRAAGEAVKAVLGEEGYRQYQQFTGPNTARDLVSSLAGNVYYSDAPLTAQQGEALAEILRANTEMVKTPMVSDGKPTMYRLDEKIDWEAVNAQAQGVLSPSQIATLRSLVQQKAADQEMMKVLNAPPAGTPH